MLSMKEKIMPSLEPYNSQYTAQSARHFARHAMQNTRILIYRDIESLLNKYGCHGEALDYGCGSGVSTRLLADLGFNVVGVDINKEMLLSAFQRPDGIPYAWMKHDKIPFKDNHFSLVLAVMVLLEMPSLQIMLQSLREITRVLKPGGLFISVVASEHLHKNNWLNRSVLNVENNHNLKTGDTYTTHSHSSGMKFTNYVYTHDDYQETFNLSQLHLIETHYALGKNTDGLNWDLETKLNPFTHYICRK
jgi:SAM-dependent methyltransferase